MGGGGGGILAPFGTGWRAGAFEESNYPAAGTHWLTVLKGPSSPEWLACICAESRENTHTQANTFEHTHKVVLAEKHLEAATCQG